MRVMQNSMFYHQKVHNYGPNTSRYSTKKKSLETQGLKPATTHMILNYKTKFFDPDDEPDRSDDDDCGKSGGKTLNPYNSVVLSKNRDDEVISKIMGDMGQKQTQLSSTFVLPKAMNRVNFPTEATNAKLDLLDNNRRVLGKVDVETQTEGTLDKIDFNGLSGYQEWSRAEVEPFLKNLRAAIKSQRPSNIQSYVSACCAAMEAGQPLPVCVSKAAPPKRRSHHK